MFTPSTMIYVDKSLSRWYGIGGEWINSGLPMQVLIYCKPESRCKIQDAATGKLGITTWLRLVKTAMEEEANSAQEDEYGLLNGTKFLLNLVEP